jgi:hypothetical protein
MSIIDFSDTIIAKSDQLNAADIADSMTIKITDAKKLQDPDQPVHIFYEGGGKKPWKPCKTMRRVIAKVWGSKVDLKDRLITVVCDPKVTWGGAEVGGIRITHMSHIDGKKTLPVRVSRHKVEKYVVLPITGVVDTKPSQEDVDADAVVEAGDLAASQGVEAFKEWAQSLEEAEKTVASKHKVKWIATAKEVDANEYEEIPL